MSRIEKIKVFLKHTPDDPFLLFSLAQEYSTQGALVEAEATYMKLKATQPDYIGLYYHLGKTQEALGKTELAAETYQLGIKGAMAANDQHAAGELRMALDMITD